MLEFAFAYVQCINHHDCSHDHIIHQYPWVCEKASYHHTHTHIHTQNLHMSCPIIGC